MQEESERAKLLAAVSLISDNSHAQSAFCLSATGLGQV
jgi:hypothetical protein